MNESSTPQSLPESVEPPIVPLCCCRACGVICEVGQQVCWMCGLQPSIVSPFAAPTVSTQNAAHFPADMPLILPVAEQNTRYDSIFLGLLAACTTLAVLVGIGLVIQDPGLLVGYLILVAPAFCITGVRALVQTGHTGRADPKKMFLSLIVSFLFTVAVVGVLFFAAIILFFGFCFFLLSGGR